MVSPIAGYVVSMGPDGKVISQGTVADVFASDVSFSAEYTEDQVVEGDMKNHADVGELEDGETRQTGAHAEADGKLIAAEEIDVGHVN